jgi:acetyl esterase/lipase
MEAEKPSESSIWLWSEAEMSAGSGAFRPWLDPYVLDTPAPLGAVLICPGGGYGGRAAHEGITIAQRLNKAGFHAFVVHYRVAPHRHPAPLLDVSRAMRLIRQGAAKWKVSPQHIAVCGFSAGGHLAASLGTHFNRDYLKGRQAVDQLSNRPDASLLCYPVISSGPFANRGSFINLLGNDATPEQLWEMSLELQVTPKTPPAFLWSTVDDSAVPVENSLLFAAALRQAGVAYEMHLYPKGPHGLGLAEQSPHIATWMPLACHWLTDLGWPSAAPL